MRFDKLIILGFQGYIANAFIEFNHKLFQDFKQVYFVGSHIKYHHKDNYIYLNYDNVFIDKLIDFKTSLVLYFTHYGRPSSEEELIDYNLQLVNNLLGGLTYNLIDMKVIYISSGGAIYGETFDNTPILETRICEPVSEYGKSKLMIENLIIQNSIKFGYEYIILRPSNLFGKVINRFDTGLIGYLESLNSLTINLYGAEIVRDYLYIGDFCNALISIIKSDIKNDIFNVSTSFSYKNIDIINSINYYKFLNGKPKINFIELPKRQFDVSYNVLENAKIKKAITWEPSFFLDTYFKTF